MRNVFNLPIFNPIRKKGDDDLTFLGVDLQSQLIDTNRKEAPGSGNAIKLIRGLTALGYKKIICTPLIANDSYENSSRILNDQFALFKQKLSMNQINTEVSLGAEYLADEYFLNSIKRKEKLISFAGRYILIKTKDDFNLMKLLDMIFRLKIAGYQPVLNEAERCPYLKDKRLRNYKELLVRGCMLKGSLLSLINTHGKKDKKCLERLIENDMISFLSSDLQSSTQLANARISLQQEPWIMNLLKKHSFLNQTLF